jgi:hypothetical protein
MVVNRTEVNKGEVVKVISSNPEDYINSTYKPGAILEFAPQT